MCWYIYFSIYIVMKKEPRRVGVMSQPPGHPAVIGLRIYRALAKAFPYEFQNAYGEAMVQVAEDAIEPIWRQHGIFGIVRLLADIASAYLPGTWPNSGRTFDTDYGRSLPRRPSRPSRVAISALSELSASFCAMFQA